jgi:hypothetical protein
MRLWSIHPRYLDRKGILAAWREGLLAKKVLQGKTKGYRSHPQLARFRKAKGPVSAICAYLKGILDESCRRGYCFDKGKIGKYSREKIGVARGQVDYEFRHLKKKLRARDPAKLAELEKVKKPEAHPLFRIRKGGIEKWEKAD